MMQQKALLAGSGSDYGVRLWGQTLGSDYGVRLWGHLVSHVKEGEELLVIHDSADLLPLFWGGVNPSGVVRTSMQKHHVLC